MFFDLSYDSIISVENLLAAWQEFVRDKRKRKDVQEFQMNLMTHIFDLHKELKNQTYCHGDYQHFVVTDPKRRDIHKASVRDRLVHHAVYRLLYPHFDTQFIHDSYSCRRGKGVHRAIRQFQDYGRTVSANNTKTCWVLTCDIRKFFASIDHTILFRVLSKYIKDSDTVWLLWNIVGSFENETGKGLPLGNLTSQLLVNIYMNEFDQYIKREVKAKYYIRYADDFVVQSRDKRALETILSDMRVFLRDRLELELHPNKVSIQTLSAGVDFLGWVHFPTHRVLRTATKRRMLKRYTGSLPIPAKQSYRGLLKHGNAYNLRVAIG